MWKIIGVIVIVVYLFQDQISDKMDKHKEKH